MSIKSSGRGGRARTGDLCVPNAIRLIILSPCNYCILLKLLDNLLVQTICIFRICRLFIASMDTYLDTLHCSPLRS